MLTWQWQPDATTPFLISSTAAGMVVNNLKGAGSRSFLHLPLVTCSLHSIQPPVTDQACTSLHMHMHSLSVALHFPAHCTCFHCPVASYPCTASAHTLHGTPIAHTALCLRPCLVLLASALALCALLCPLLSPLFSSVCRVFLLTLSCRLRHNQRNNIYTVSSAAARSLMHGTNPIVGKLQQAEHAVQDKIHSLVQKAKTHHKGYATQTLLAAQPTVVMAPMPQLAPVAQPAPVIAPTRQEPPPSPPPMANKTKSVTIAGKGKSITVTKTTQVPVSSSST